MVTKVGGVAIEIRGDNAHFDRTMREVRREAGRTGQTMTREFRQADVAAKSLNTTLRSTAGSVAAMAAALGAGVGLAAGIRTLADFSQGMSTVKAITQATEAQFVALEEKAKLLGATTRFSASQASEAMLFLARAGFNVDQILGSVEGTLQLAQAGALDLGAAADIASNILTGFRLEVDQTNRVVDLMAFLANSANTDIRQLGDAMKFVAPVAAGLGVSIEEAAAAVGALSDAGLQGSMAGTGLRRVLSSLENPTTAARKIFEELGVSTDEVRISSVGLTAALKRLSEAGVDTGQALQIFGDRGGPAFAVLADSIPKVEAQNAALQKAGGTAERVSKIMDDNLNGAILGTLSAMEALILEMGKIGVTDALTTAFKGLAELLRFAARNADVLGVAIVALAARALIPMAARAIPAAIASLNALGASLIATQGLAARAALAMSFVGGPLTLAIAGAAAAYIAYSRSVLTAEEAQAKFNSTADKLQKVRDDTRKATDELTAANDRLKSAIEAQATAAEATARAEINAINQRLRKNRELEASYRAQLALDLNRARTGAQSSENRLGERFGLRATFDFTSNRNVDDGQLDAKISEFMRRADAIQKAGGVLSKYDAQTLEWIIQYREYQETLRGLEGAFNDLTRKPTFGNDFREYLDPAKAPAATGNTEAASAEVTLNRDLLALKDAQFQIDLARAQGNEALARALEEDLAILELQLEYQEAGLDALEAMDRAIRDIVLTRQAATQLAKEQAEADEDAARALAAYEEFYLRRKESEAARKEQQDLDDAARQRIADGIARGLEDGIRSGNWGEAFRTILAQSTSEALRQAINDLAGELLSLFRGVFSGGVNFGGIGSIFGGGRASGGRVRPGMRYMVGEQGPEMFVPNVPGIVVPKMEGPTSAAMNGVTGMQSLSVSAPLIVQGSITEDVLPRVQAMMAEQARALPRIIDARVSDSIRRNRY